MSPSARPRRSTSKQHPNNERGHGISDTRSFDWKNLEVIFPFPIHGDSSFRSYSVVISIHKAATDGGRAGGPKTKRYEEEASLEIVEVINMLKKVRSRGDNVVERRIYEVAVE